MFDHFHQLFAYDAWANPEVLASLRTAGRRLARALELTAHVFSAQHVWLARLLQQTQPFPVWPDFSLPQCEAQAAELPILWTRYLNAATEDSLTHAIAYRNTIGESWNSRISDILTHVVMHSAYHRGQVASVMRAAGFVPMSSPVSGKAWLSRLYATSFPQVFLQTQPRDTLDCLC